MNESSYKLVYKQDCLSVESKADHPRSYRPTALTLNLWPSYLTLT